jgi:Conserved TM helix
MLFADVGESVQRGADEFALWVPRFLGFLAVLIIGYFVAKIVASLLGRVLRRLGLDEHLQKGTAGNWISKVTRSPSGLIGSIAFWLVFIGAVSIALDVLGIQALQDFVAAIWAYVPNLIAAFLIFLVAAAIAAGVGTLVSRTMGETTTGKVVATVVPILIMAVAGFMILDQLRIAETIVTITYASLLGAIALGMALAFGLGGREVAARMLEGAYQAGQQNREQIKQDLRQGRERTAEEADRMRAKVEGEEPEIEGDTMAAPPRRVQGVQPLEDEPVAFEPDQQLEGELERQPGTRRK